MFNCSTTRQSSIGKTHVLIKHGCPIIRVLLNERNHTEASLNVFDAFLQELFNLPVHWLQASGVVAHILDPYMNREAIAQLPKKTSSNEPLNLVQLIMLWLIWASGMAVGTLAFLVELKFGSLGKARTLNYNMRKGSMVAWGKEENVTTDGDGK